jgi:hypothetical protein
MVVVVCVCSNKKGNPFTRGKYQQKSDILPKPARHYQSNLIQFVLRFIQIEEQVLYKGEIPVMKTRGLCIALPT